MRALIVGGAGFIGTHLTHRLAAAGHEVTVLDRLAPQVHGARARFSPALRRVARCLRGDARRSADLSRALRGQDVIYWLVAETGTGQSMYRVERYVGTNVSALAALFDVVVRQRLAPRRIVLASSRAIYGEGAYHCAAHGLVVPGPRAGRDPGHGWWPGCPVCGAPATPLPTPEEAPPRPTSVYGWTKLAQEQLLEVMAGPLGIERTVLRLQNVYGPGQAPRNPYTGVLLVFFKRALAGAPLVLYEDGDITRDFVHVDDAVAALAAAGTRRAAAAGAFNIGTGVPVSIREAAERVIGSVGSGSPIEVGGQFRLGDVRFALADIARARAALRYRPRIGFADGIRDLAAWMAEQDASPDRSAASAREMARFGLLRELKP